MLKTRVATSLLVLGLTAAELSSSPYIRILKINKTHTHPHTRNYFYSERYLADQKPFHFFKIIILISTYLCAANRWCHKTCLDENMVNKFIIKKKKEKKRT